MAADRKQIQGASVCQDLTEEFNSVSRDGPRWLRGSLAATCDRTESGRFLSYKKVTNEVERMKEANQFSRAEREMFPLIRSANRE